MNLFPDKSNIIDPRQDRDLRECYFTIKDLRFSTRQKEKYGDASPAILNQWKTINQGLAELFAAGCADLELCSWQVEAALRLEGFAGLEQAFQFVHKLIETYGSALSSIESFVELPQYWIAPISELSGEGNEGVLIQPLRLCPLVPQSVYGTHNLWYYKNTSGQLKNDTSHLLIQSVREVGEQAMDAQRKIICACITAYEKMLALLDGLLPEPPARTNLLAILQECIRAINDLTGFDETDVSLDQTVQVVTEPYQSQPVPSAAQPQTKIADREQALKLLGDVALFFRKQEPQSPIAPVLETLIRRGRLSFDALLEDLLPDEDARRTILQSAGILSANHDVH